jgi:hypothetical protein
MTSNLEPKKFKDKFKEYDFDITKKTKKLKTILGI